MSDYQGELIMDNDRTFRWICIVLSIAFLTAAFIVGLADDTPDIWLFASFLGASGVFAVLRP